MKKNVVKLFNITVYNLIGTEISTGFLLYCEKINNMK